jgi:DNA-directed RNA polymerase specialized sigma24 family protein
VPARDEENLRRFVACRDTGDLDGARVSWARLLEDNFDRIRAMVDAWGWDKLSADERAEAVSRAGVRLWRNMISTFQGTSMGEWVNATRRCVAYACADVQRAAARRNSAEVSLDRLASDAEGEGASGYERRIGRIAQEEQRREAERTEARDGVARGLSAMSDARQRLVLERSLDGVPAPDIAAELGVSMPNLYQLRSRGQKELARLIREDGG